MIRIGWCEMIFAGALCGALMGTVPAAGAQAGSLPQPSVRTVNVRPITRSSRIAPPAINQLVAARNVAIATGHGAQLKNVAVKKFVCGLSAPERPVLARHGHGVVSMLGRLFGAGIKNGEPADAAVACAEQASVLAVMAPSAAPGSAGLSKMRSPRATVWQSDVATMSWDAEDALRLESGEVLVLSTDDLDVSAGEMKVHLKPGTAALFAQARGVTRVMNLIDRRHDAVRVRVCNRPVVLAPGWECCFAESESAVNACRLGDGCGRRAHRLICDHGGTSYLGVCEVSVASVIKHHPIVRQIYHSDEKSERRLANDVLKMAACLAHSTRSYKPYVWSE
jgi:hypothetical protein